MTLTELQQTLKAPKNQYNSFGKYNYRSCEDILEALKPLLAKEDELTISDSIKESCGIPYVEAEVSLKIGGIRHTSKAQAGINPNKKGMDISQSFGSSSSYARKYALNAMFLIDDTKDSDGLDNSKSDPIKEKLEACKSLEELQKAYLSLTKSQQKEYVNIKDEMKTILS